MRAFVPVAALGLSMLAVAVALVVKPAAAAAPPVFIPTGNDISSAPNLASLDAYYELIGELKITGEIDTGQYSSLYIAYETRYLELTGGSA